MTSIGPYSQSYDMKHMAHFTDLRGPLPRREYRQNSIMGVIANHPDFTRFAYMLKLAKLNHIYNDSQANFTLFVPSDKALARVPEGVFTNMDDATARHIIHSSTLENRITVALLEDSPASYYVTMSRANKLFITNMNGKTYVNNCLQVVQKDIECGNGLIHVVDGLIWPTMI